MRPEHLLLAWLAAAPASAGEFDALYQAEAAKHGLDWRLVKAVARVESSENPRAENRRDPSVGLMQLLCKYDAQGRCTNRLRLDGWAGVTREQLLDPATNVRFGTAILAWNIRTYGLRRGVACYNAFRACLDAQAEPFSNQAYLEKVMRIHRGLLGRAGGGRAKPVTPPMQAGSRPAALPPR